MKYTREIDNDIMIQYIILFTMSEAKRHLTYKQLSELVFNNCNIEFSNFQIALTNLEETGHIRKFSLDEFTTVYELLPKGIEANTFFKANIPIYIKEPICESIPPYFNEEEIKRSVRTELVPINRHEFAAKCGVYDKDATLLEVTVYAGTREDANKMMQRFNEKPDEIYTKIIGIMSGEEQI